MESKPSIIYFGFGTLGVECLKALLSKDARIRAVVPRDSDLQNSPQPSSVYHAARDLGLAVRRYADFAPNSEFFNELLKDRPDYLISIQFDKILKKSLIEVPRFGALNLHFAPLPKLRGCFPTKWSIILGEDSGVTLHYIDPGVDTGPIIDQIVVTPSNNETDQSLYLKLQESGRELFNRNLNAIISKDVPHGVPQDNKKSSYFPKKVPYERFINWHENAVQVERFIRAFTFPPYPAARTSVGGVQFEIRYPVKIDSQTTNLAPGTFILEADGTGRIVCSDGAIIFSQVIIDQVDKPVKTLIRYSGTVCSSSDL